MSEYISGGLTLAAIITLLALYRKQCKYSNIKGKESAYAGVWWICIFACGLLLYFIACVSSSRPEGQSVVSFILLSIAKSLSASLKMFSFNFETSIIFNIASANGAAGYIFCAAVVACFISAASWTIIMAKNVFLKGIGNEFDIFFHAHKGWHRRFFPKIPPSKHYIVIGCGQARLFLENLVKTVNKKNITVITGQNADKEKYRDLIAKGYTVIFGKADELTLRRAGIFNKNCKTIVVAMSEKDEENLFVAKFITNYVREKVKPQKQANGRIASLTAGQIEILKSIDISVYAMYSYLERSEHFSFTEYALGKVRFFSPYDVRARKFIMDNPITALIPPGWINTQKGRLKSPSEREDGVKRPLQNQQRIRGLGMTTSRYLKRASATISCSVDTGLCHRQGYPGKGKRV